MKQSVNNIKIGWQSDYGSTFMQIYIMASTFDTSSCHVQPEHALTMLHAIKAAIRTNKYWQSLFDGIEKLHVNQDKHLIYFKTRRNNIKVQIFVCNDEYFDTYWQQYFASRLLILGINGRYNRNLRNTWRLIKLKELSLPVSVTNDDNSNTNTTNISLNQADLELFDFLLIAVLRCSYKEVCARNGKHIYEIENVFIEVMEEFASNNTSISLTGLCHHNSSHIIANRFSLSAKLWQILSTTSNFNSMIGWYCSLFKPDLNNFEVYNDYYKYICENFKCIKMIPQLFKRIDIPILRSLFETCRLMRHSMHESAWITDMYMQVCGHNAACAQSDITLSCLKASTATFKDFKFQFIAGNVTHFHSCKDITSNYSDDNQHSYAEVADLDICKHDMLVYCTNSHDFTFIDSDLGTIYSIKQNDLPKVLSI